MRKAASVGCARPVTPLESRTIHKVTVLSWLERALLVLVPHRCSPSFLSAPVKSQEQNQTRPPVCGCQETSTVRFYFSCHVDGTCVYKKENKSVLYLVLTLESRNDPDGCSLLVTYWTLIISKKVVRVIQLLEWTSSRSYDHDVVGGLVGGCWWKVFLNCRTLDVIPQNIYINHGWPAGYSRTLPGVEQILQCGSLPERVSRAAAQIALI